MSASDSSPNRFSEAAAIVAEIEAEMKRSGYWSTELLPPEAYAFQQAFAMDTMTFSQWLQFVLIPRVHQIIADRGTFPNNSMVGVKAVREFDGDERASRLVSLLGEFDRLFTEGGQGSMVR